MPKILIVEDELPIADLIRLTLKSAGYLCDHAPDGDQAADLAAAGNYDLALVDVMLPRTDGFTLLEYFQSLELPVIFVTARSAVADRVKGLKLGAEDYIVKPFDVAELLARVETVLRRFHKTEETLSLAGVRGGPPGPESLAGGGGGLPDPQRVRPAASLSSQPQRRPLPGHHL